MALYNDVFSRLKAERTYLLGDCLLSAAFISYAGPLTKPYRYSTLRVRIIQRGMEYVKGVGMGRDFYVSLSISAYLSLLLALC